MHNSAASSTSLYVLFQDVAAPARQGGSGSHEEQ